MRIEGWRPGGVKHLPVWQPRITINLNVVYRPLCRIVGHSEKTGVGISAPAPVYCERCWKTLGYA